MRFRGRARGRLKPGTMNRLESAYAAELELQRRTGLVMWYQFEAVKLRLANATFYTPDFCVMTKDGFIEFHEAKGYWEDDARVKIKVAATIFPFRFIAVQPKPQKEGGGWKVEVFE